MTTILPRVTHYPYQESHETGHQVWSQKREGGVKLGLNSEAVTPSGLPEVLRKTRTGVGAVVDCCHEGITEVLFAPKMNGFADGFKEADLGPAENDGIILVGLE